jgi:hypothetical protein
MKNDILIQFSRDQWKRLEPHIQGIASDVGIFDWFTQEPEPMIMCNEEIYERVITVARTHCPDLVSHIESEKQRSVHEAALRKK